MTLSEVETVQPPLPPRKKDSTSNQFFKLNFINVAIKISLRIVKIPLRQKLIRTVIKKFMYQNMIKNENKQKLFMVFRFDGSIFLWSFFPMRNLRRRIFVPIGDSKAVAGKLGSVENWNSKGSFRVNKAINRYGRESLKISRWRKKGKI